MSPARDSTRLAALPIINLDPYLNPTDGKGRISTAAALHAACLQYGFFYLDISNYIDSSDPEELMRLAREFFAMSDEEKLKIGLARQDGARGYQRLKENVTNGKADNHEGIDFYRPVENPDKTKPLWGENQWPDIPGFREKYETWVEKMKRLGLLVMEAMSVGLGMTPEEWKELRAQVDDSFWVMRIIGYPPLPDDYDGYSCGAHRDYGCLTFLYADPTPGALQVFLPQKGLVVQENEPSAATTTTTTTGKPNEIVEEGVWIDADPIPGCIVCNIGEMWEIWTNGLYKSTLHRVMHRSSNYRVSIPFFFEPNFSALVKPLPAAIRLQHDGPSTPINPINPVLSASPLIPLTPLPPITSSTASSSSSEVTKPRQMSTSSTRSNSRPAELHGPPAPGIKYDPVVYGEFLMGKVAGNFDSSGKGRYD